MPPEMDIEQVGEEEENEFTKDGSMDIFGQRARRKTTGGWKSAAFVLGYQVLGTITYAGVATNLVLYLRGSLNLSTGAAANADTNWVGTSYATALIGAFLGDAYLGRYWASVLFVAIHFLGTLLLTIQAAIPSMRPFSCDTQEICKPASRGQKALLYSALYISALGVGGHQSCMTALGADQFDDNYPPESQQKSSFFSYFVASAFLGSLFVTIVLSYVEVNHSYAIGFGVCTATIVIAGFLFIGGITFYRHFKPGGNPFARALQVLVAAIRKCNVRLPSDITLLYEQPASEGRRRIHHSSRLRFLDKAATPTEAEADTRTESANPWRLCTVTQVEEVKCVVLMMPLWVSACFYQMIAAQVCSTFVEQGASMDTQLGTLNVSPASLYTFYTIAVIVGAPAYEKVFVPLARSVTKNPRGVTMLQRMGVGNVIMMLAMVVAAGVEIKRLQVVQKHNLQYDPVPISVFWQAPQYVLCGIAEVFTFVAQTEFFYDQVPDGVRGIGSALSMASVAVGNYLSTLTVTIVNRITNNSQWLPMNLNHGRLDLFFWVMALICTINFVYFLLFARAYRYINVEKADEIPKE